MDVLNAIAAFTNFVLIPTITYGSQLSLGALGITLVFGILRFSNVAHGDTMAFGTAMTILVTWWLQYMGVSFGPLPTALIALPIGILVCVALVLFTDVSVYRFFRRKAIDPILLVIVSIGVMFITNGLVRLIIGPDDRRFIDGERFIFSASEFKQFSGLQEGVAFKSSQAITVVVAIVAVAWLFWFLNRTRTGKSMRAYSDNEELALLSGINPERIVVITWCIVAILATIAGTLYGLDKSFNPFTYFQLLLPMFASAIVGGYGSPIGAIIGGYFVAFSEILLTYPLKKVLTYLLPESLEPTGLFQLLSTDYKFAVSFVILVIVLMVRPTGIVRRNKYE